MILLLPCCDDRPVAAVVDFDICSYRSSKAKVLLQFDVVKSLEDPSQEPVGSIPVFGKNVDTSEKKEAQVEVVLSFAEDIVPFALDTTLMVQWIFSVSPG